MNPTTSKLVLLAAIVPCLVLIALFLNNAREGFAKTVTPCDFARGPCVLETEDGVKIEFDILPKPVTAMSELFFVITVTKNNALLSDAAVLLELSMPGMFMGRNRPVLKQTAKGRYEGKGFITRCASGRKTWQANILVEKNGKTTVADFVFEVY